MGVLAVSLANSQETNLGEVQSSQITNFNWWSCPEIGLWGVRFFPVTCTKEQQTLQVWGWHQWSATGLQSRTPGFNPWILHLQAVQPGAHYWITTFKPRIHNRIIIQKKADTEGLRAGEYGVQNNLMVLGMKIVFTL